MSRWPIAKPVFRGAALVLAISLAMMTVSVYMNESGLRALVGRAYSMVMLLLEVAGYYILIRQSDNKGRTTLVLGVMIGVCCHYFYPNDLRVLDEPIKFLLGIPLGVGLLALYALAVPRGSASVALLVVPMLAYALFCFLVGSRSNGGVFFVSAMLVAVVPLVPTPRAYGKYAPFMILIAGIAGYAVTELYTYLALQGYFGFRAANVAAFQSSFGSILLGGRPETIINMQGIKDAPVLGVGIENYPSIYIHEMVNLAAYDAESVLSIDGVLYHSALFATAFETGIVSALFWGAMLYITLFAIPLTKALSPSFRAAVMPLLMITVWHILYSPPIPYNRFMIGLGLAIAFFLFFEWKQRSASSDQVTERIASNVASAHRTQL